MRTQKSSRTIATSKNNKNNCPAERQGIQKGLKMTIEKKASILVCLTLLALMLPLVPLLMGKSLSDPQYKEGFATGTGGDQEAILDRGEERLRWFPEQRNINEELLYQLEDAYSGHPKEWKEYKAQFNINLKERGINVSMEEYLKGGALKYETVPAWDFKTQELSFEFNKGFIVNNK